MCVYARAPGRVCVCACARVSGLRAAVILDALATAGAGGDLSISVRVSSDIPETMVPH